MRPLKLRILQGKSSAAKSMVNIIKMCKEARSSTRASANLMWHSTSTSSALVDDDSELTESQYKLVLREVGYYEYWPDESPDSLTYQINRQLSKSNSKPLSNDWLGFIVRPGWSSSRFNFMTDDGDRDEDE
jgi:hypothetical protein